MITESTQTTGKMVGMSCDSTSLPISLSIHPSLNLAMLLLCTEWRSDMIDPKSISRTCLLSASHTWTNTFFVRWLSSRWSQSIPFSPYTINGCVKDWKQIICTTFLLLSSFGTSRHSFALKERTTNLQLSYDNRAPSSAVKAWISRPGAKSGEHW